VALRMCLDNDPDVQRRLEADMKTAAQLGFKSTPTFAVGSIDREGHVAFTKVITGAQGKDIFQKVINEALAQTNHSGAP